MILKAKRGSALVLRLIVGLALLGYPVISNAAGPWTVIPLPQQIAVPNPVALVVDAAGNLYIADQSSGGGVQKRDTLGNWSVIAIAGTDLGQVDLPSALAIDAAGELYVADVPGEWGSGRIQKRDAHGSWSLVAVSGTDSGQVTFETWWGITAALGADAEGSLYIADGDEGGRVQKRDTQGNWFTLATAGDALGQFYYPSGFAVAENGDLYIAEWADISRIQKRDVQGKWSVLPLPGAIPGQVDRPTLLAVDTAGNLYLVDQTRIGSALSSQIQRQDLQGAWSVIAPSGFALGQVSGPSALAVDGARNLYVADTGNDRVLKYTPGP